MSTTHSAAERDSPRSSESVSPAEEPPIAVDLVPEVAAHVATVEAGTTRTEAGSDADVLWRELRAQGDDWGVECYVRTLQQGLRLIGDGLVDYDCRSVMEVIAGVVKGREVLQDADYGYGSFEGTVSPNLRFPIPHDFSPMEIRAVVAIVSRGLNQVSGAASRFQLVEYAADDSCETATFSVDVPAGRPPTLDEIETFQEILKYPINVEVHSEGFIFDIVPVTENGETASPEVERVLRAVTAVFNEKGGADKYDYRIIRRVFLSEFLEHEDYQTAIDDLKTSRDAEKAAIREDERGSDQGSGDARAPAADPIHDTGGDAEVQVAKEPSRAVGDALAAASDGGRGIDELLSEFVSETKVRREVEAQRRAMREEDRST